MTQCVSNENIVETLGIHVTEILRIKNIQEGILAQARVRVSSTIQRILLLTVQLRVVHSCCFANNTPNGTTTAVQTTVQVTVLHKIAD